jgi:predicted nucleic-acid-binding Zn-ribbon protein
VEADLFHAYRRTAGQRGMAKLIVAYRNFANAPKNSACTSYRTQRVVTTHTNRLYYLREIIAVFYLTLTIQTNKYTEFYDKQLF